MELKDFKKEYVKLALKYKMPSFEELNENFEIERIEKETEILLRAVRKLMMEKVVNSMNFIEMLLNPVNSPRMYLPFISGMTVEDKNCIDKIYDGLGELSLLALDLEVDFTEKGEAELINKIFKKWNELKPEFRKVLARMRSPNNVVKRERSYFG